MLRRYTTFKRHFLTLSGLLLVVTLFIIPSTAFASSYSSGPSGSEVNGWYKDSSSIVFIWQHVTQPGDNYVGVCGAPPGSQVGQANSIVYNFLEGQHSYNFLTNSHGDIYVSVDSQSSQPIVAVCNNGGSGFIYPYPPDPGSILWQGDVDVDNSSPTVSITSPANNSNAYTSSVTVSGTVSDTGSGIAKVLVNGQQASISGNSFSITLSLNQGLNTVTATAYDQVGHSSTSNSIVIDSSAPTASNNSSGTSSGTINTSTGTKSNGSKSSSGTLLVTKASGSSNNDPKSINGKNSSLNLASKPTASKSGMVVGSVAVVLVLVGFGLSIKFGWLKVLKQRLKKV